MIVEPTMIPDVLLLTPPRFVDERGFFSETWNERRFVDAGILGPFVQDNHVRSVDRGVVRGLNLQVDPNAQGKLIRVVRGSIWDVAVDIRRNSSSYGRMRALFYRQITGSSCGSRWGCCTATARSNPLR
jgi:dTDP-4-dehydrorhamnose 3,5-epimerase